MKRRWLTAGLVMLVSAGVLAAEPGRGSSAEEDAVKRFFARLFQDQKTIFTAPFRGATWQQPSAWVIVAISGASFALDDGPSRELRENQDFRCFNDFFAAGATGTVLTVYPLAVLATGSLWDHQGMSDYGRRSTRAALNAILAATVIKAVTQRSRPHSGQVYGFWDGGNSFYSGHSTVAWALAAATARQFPRHRWVPWVAYPLAGAVTFSRVSSGNHFMSDAVVGSAAGFAIGYWVVQ